MLLQPSVNGGSKITLEFSVLIPTDEKPAGIAQNEEEVCISSTMKERQNGLDVKEFLPSL